MRNINFGSQYQQKLLSSNTKVSSTQLSIHKTSYATPKAKRQSLIQPQIAFLLCKSCYWCLSLLDLRVQIELCPVCKDIKLVRMPIF